MFCSLLSSDELTLQTQIDDLKVQLNKASPDASKALEAAKQSNVAVQQAAPAAQQPLEYVKEANSKLDNLLIKNLGKK